MVGQAQPGCQWLSQLPHSVTFPHRPTAVGLLRRHQVHLMVQGGAGLRTTITIWVWRVHWCYCGAHPCNCHRYSHLVFPHSIQTWSVLLRVCIPKVSRSIIVNFGFTTILCSAVRITGNSGTGTSAVHWVPDSEWS